MHDVAYQQCSKMCKTVSDSAVGLL